MNKKQQERDEFCEDLTKKLSSLEGYEDMRVEVSDEITHARGVVFTDTLVHINIRKFDEMRNDPRNGDSKKARVLNMALYLMSRYNERHEHNERQRRLNVMLAKGQILEGLRDLMESASSEELDSILFQITESIEAIRKEHLS